MSKRERGPTSVGGNKATKTTIATPMDVEASIPNPSDIVVRYKQVGTGFAAQLQGAMAIIDRSQRLGHLSSDLTNGIEMEELVSSLGRLEQVVVGEFEIKTDVSIPTHQMDMMLSGLQTDIVPVDATPLMIASRRDTILESADTLSGSVVANLQLCTEATTLLDILNGATRMMCEVFLVNEDSFEHVLDVCVDSIRTLYALLRRCQTAAFALNEYYDITKIH